jgi:hypothetical protein
VVGEAPDQSHELIGVSLEVKLLILEHRGRAVPVKLPKGLDNLINIVDIDGHLTTPSWRSRRCCA